MNTYLLLKTIHLFGVMLFLGNIIITGWWKFMANKTANPVIIAFAQRQVTLTDYVFTAVGAAILLAAGMANAMLHDMAILQTKWLLWGLILFSLSGLIWVFILIPIQYQQAKAAREFADGGTIPESYWRREAWWYVFGITATILPLLNLYWMVYKPV